MKKIILMTSLMVLFVLSAVPAFAQEADVQPNVTTDQYGPDITAIQSAADDAIQRIVENGGDTDGAAAYKAALGAARDAGADEATAETVATEAVADISEEPETSGKEKQETPDKKEPEMTELPDTGGAMNFALGTGLLVVGAGLLARRIIL